MTHDQMITTALVVVGLATAIRFVWWKIDKQARWEAGLKYAREELAKSDDISETIDRLLDEADVGKLLDPSPFDDAIRYVVHGYGRT